MTAQHCKVRLLNVWARRSVYLGREGSHAEPEALLEGELPLLVVVLVALLVVLITVRTEAVEHVQEHTGERERRVRTEGRCGRECKKARRGKRCVGLLGAGQETLKRRKKKSVKR